MINMNSFVAVAGICIQRASGVGTSWKTRVCADAESSTFTSQGSALPLSVTVRRVYPFEWALWLPGGLGGFGWDYPGNGVPPRAWAAACP